MRKLFTVLMATAFITAVAAVPPAAFGKTVKLPIDKSPVFEVHDPPITIVTQERTGSEAPGTKKQMEYWNENYSDLTGITLKQKETPRSGYYTKINNILFAQNPRPDIVLTYNIFLPMHAKAGVATDLTDWWNNPKFYPYDKDDLFPITRELMKYNGKVYGIPTDTNSYYLIYRKDLIDNPPKTYEQLFETAKQWTKKYNSNSPTDYGLAFYGRAAQSTPMFWYQIFKSHGGEFFDDRMKPQFSSEAGVEALSWVQNAVESEVVPPDISTYEFVEILGALQTGKVAMAIQWGAAGGILMNEEASPKVHDKIDMTFVPGVRRDDGGLVRRHSAHNLNMEISAASRHKKAAFKYLAWAFGSQEGLEIYAGDGWNPPHKSIARQERFQEMNPRNVLQDRIFTEYAYKEPMLPDYPAVKDILMSQLLKAWTGGPDPETVLEEADRKIEQLLQRKGYYD